MVYGRGRGLWLLVASLVAMLAMATVDSLDPPRLIDVGVTALPSGSGGLWLNAAIEGAEPELSGRQRFI